ncbi:MAG: glycoside hydrolase family 5 protein [Prevotella sp.]|nr:glycoside hydrolase family 5 protein [Prevotella sp.]
MNKRIFTIICLLATFITLHAQEFETATEAVKNMKVGWNLGNTFDSHKIGVTGVTETETLREPITKPELMEMMKMAGFNAIRVPVTWYPHLDASGNIDPAWMNRIQEVVDYVINQGMYCIINVHHDTGHKKNENDGNKGWLRAKRENYLKNKELFEIIWQQIATEFKDYNHLLLFEGYNEMLDTLGSFNYASYETDKRIDITNEQGDVVAQIPYDADVAQSAYDAVNAYAKSFVETVRATGGNNAHRNLIVSTYAAADARSQGTYNKEPFVKMQKPEDSNHIAFEIHTYPPIVDDTLRSMEYIARQIDYMVSNIDTFFVQRYNAPVIIGEWGTSNVDAGSEKTDYDLHREHMFNFVDYFVQKMKENDIATFYWMGLSDKTNRSLPAFNQADLAERILKAYYGNDYEPNLITTNDYEDYNGYEVNFTKQWAEITLAESTSGLESEYTGIEVILDELPSYNGNLSFRTYNLSEANINHSNITSLTNTLNFSGIAATGKPIKRVTIVWRSSPGAPTLKIKEIKLLKADGTKTRSIPKNRNACTITPYSLPTYIKSKISDLNYSTLYYGNENLVVPPYVTATAYSVNGNKLQAVKTYNTDDVIPAGTGVVLYSEKGNTYKFDITNESGEPAIGNMLRGSDAAATTTGGDRYYMLSLNAASDPTSVGFYYARANGAAFTNGAHKAYLALPTAQAKAFSYLFNETDGISTIPNDKAETANGIWYTIDGKRLNGQPTKKGVYIVDGKKVVIR